MGGACVGGVCMGGGVLEAVLLRDGYRFLSKWWLVGVSRRLLMSLAKLVLKPQCFVYLFIVSRIVYAAVVGDVFFFLPPFFLLPELCTSAVYSV